MQRGERIVKKLVFIHLALLIIIQGWFHRPDVLEEWKSITFYEGVTKQNFTNILETFSGATPDE
ncbi:YpfB family protein [Bacillus fonticola]|uniref:YpfB family protein n=1 Tax=Bacillus fonticola TaxID=2728853 RepID=UPI001474C2A5|nr:YpfB family protein [Bacillus fonticola]